MLSHLFGGSNGCEFIKETFVFHKSKPLNDFFANLTVRCGLARRFLTPRGNVLCQLHKANVGLQDLFTQLWQSLVSFIKLLNYSCSKMQIGSPRVLSGTQTKTFKFVHECKEWCLIMSNKISHTYGCSNILQSFCSATANHVAFAVLLFKKS